MYPISYITEDTIQEKDIVLVGGCFDLLHYGHIMFLKQAKDKGSYLIIALESDEMIKKYKKRRPTHNQAQRKEMLEALKYVDKVISLPLMNGYDDYLALVKKIKPKVIVITKGDPHIVYKQNQAKEVGATVEEIPLEKGLSSTEILKQGIQK
jgi:FAD synthetase